ncbi:MAG: TonB family protein [Bacteroidales bacterium]|nr:TonB family protein [Bacteroidales bacterium]
MHLLRSIFILFYLFAPLFIYAQEIEYKVVDEPIYEYVNKRASFPGGAFARYEYLHNVIDFSQKTLKQKKDGPVQVNFVVEKDGSITNLELRMSLIKVLDNQVLEAVRNMPNWIPAELLGKKVRSYNSIHVNFISETIKLEDLAERIHKLHYPIQRAMVAMETQHYNEAVAYFSMYLSEYPKDSFALYYRGGAFYNLNRHREACIDWKDSQDANSQELFSAFCEGMRGVKYYSSVDTNYQKYLDTLAVINHCVIDFDSSAYFSHKPDALRKFYKRNMTKWMIKKYVIPVVIVSFDVLEDGSVENVWIVRSYSNRYDKEAIALVNKMPKWKAATKNGKEVKTKVLLPIHFNDKSTKSGKFIHDFFER